MRRGASSQFDEWHTHKHTVESADPLIGEAAAVLEQLQESASKHGLDVIEELDDWAGADEKTRLLPEAQSDEDNDDGPSPSAPEAPLVASRTTRNLPQSISKVVSGVQIMSAMLAGRNMK
jgi:hypothetical protein|eukprot:SAG25_NODE_1090_length_4042_cov_1.648237_8_plen_120_part_00